MKVRRDIPWLAGLVVLIAAAVFVQPAPKQDQVPHVDWSQPFNICGVVLGMTKQQLIAAAPGDLLRAWHGGYEDGSEAPDVLFVFGHRKNGQQDVSVRAMMTSLSGRVDQIIGSSLSQGSRTLLIGNETKATIQALLGKPTSVMDDSHNLLWKVSGGLLEVGPGSPLYVTLWLRGSGD